MSKRKIDGSSGICNLTDDILQHILSFLPFKEAVRLSILSRRWRNVWTTVPFLEFNELSFGPKYYTNEEDRETIRYRTFLISVFSTLMHYTAARIRKFKLSLIDICRHELNSAADQWILFALKKKVEELYLDFSARYEYLCLYAPDELPDENDIDHSGGACSYFLESHGFKFNLSLLSGRSLRALSLKDCNVDLPGAIDLSLLETLTLTRVELKQGGLQQLVLHLISSCPILKNLALEGYGTVKSGHIVMEELRFSCSQLKSMTLKCCHNLYLIEIDAPGLQSFEYEGDFAEGFKLYLTNSVHLTSVEINFCGELDGQLNDLDTRFGDYISNFVDVEYLCVYPSYLKDVMITRDFKDPCCPIFQKLKKLKLAGEMLFNSSVLGVFSFLSVCPKLEHLTLSLVFDKDDEEPDPEDKGLQELQNISINCLHHHLKVIKIENFVKCKTHSSLAKFLLKHATVLEEMIVEGGRASFSEHLKLEARIISWKINPITKITYC